MTARGLLLATTAAAVAGGSASTASAANPAVTVQAQQADAAFLAYAPPATGGAGALCLVDTGVNSNPDTAPGLIGSYGVDGGTTGDVDPSEHGTLMAMIAGAAGNGMIGAWPLVKIVSVRATNDPSPGQTPTFEFDNYWQGLDYCGQEAIPDRIKVVDLALSSPIPPTPDQAATFATAVSNLEDQNVAVVAAAGNTPGAAEEPGAERNVLSVGASTAQPGSLSDTPVGEPCSFTATTGVGIMAPGCGLDAASPITGQPLCCEDGTSEASAFTAAVLAALMSYDPSLSYVKAEDLLVQTANDGNLDVAAAFQADSLGAIVTAGNARTPAPPATPTTTTTTTTPTTTPTPSGTAGSGAPTSKSNGGVYPVMVRATWRRGRIWVELIGRHGRVTVDVTLRFRRHTKHLARRVKRHMLSLTIVTRRPLGATVRVMSGRHALSAATQVSL
jgi:hypothetical protein